MFYMYIIVSAKELHYDVNIETLYFLQLVIEAENRKANVFKLDLLLCDIVKTSWCREWLKEFSNAPTKCPYYPVSTRLT